MCVQKICLCDVTTRITSIVVWLAVEKVCCFFFSSISLFVGLICLYACMRCVCEWVSQASLVMNYFRLFCWISKSVQTICRSKTNTELMFCVKVWKMVLDKSEKKCAPIVRFQSSRMCWLHTANKQKMSLLCKSVVLVPVRQKLPCKASDMTHPSDISVNAINK